MAKHLHNGEWLTVSEMAFKVDISPSGLYRRKKDNPEKTYSECAMMDMTLVKSRGRNKKNQAMADTARALGVPLGQFLNRAIKFGLQIAVEMPATTQRSGRKKGAKTKKIDPNITENMDKFDFDPDLEITRRIAAYRKKGLSDKIILQRCRPV